MKYWMAPNGDIVATERHSSWEYKGRQYQYGRDDLSGWLRLVTVGDILYIGSLTSLTPRQINSAKSFALERGFRLFDDADREVPLTEWFVRSQASALVERVLRKKRQYRSSATKV